jgi:HTH-type transcriptional regulator/antitoxin HigA
MITHLIKTKAEYDAALKRLDQLIHSRPGTPDADELELLSALVELYERNHFEVLPPDPIEAIKFRIEQAGLKAKDLIPIMGSRGKVSEVLSGKRPLSLAIIRALNEQLGIPADILLRQPQGSVSSKVLPHPEKFPWGEIVERNWLAPLFRGTVKQAQERALELARYLLRNLRDDDLNIALFRRNVRGARIDDYALLAWTARIVNLAKEGLRPSTYRRGSINNDFMRNLISFSILDQGPFLVKEFLFKSGIILVIERHLQRTHVDGAATVLDDGTPVIGLSLRHDRLDNFWFCLCHELAHINLHIDEKKYHWFVDDLDIADTSREERDADRWAMDRLISPEQWMTIADCDSILDVERAAQKIRVHPAIIAGRIRYERKNYRVFSNLVGQGEVRRLLLS